MSSDTGGAKTANFFSYAMRIGWLSRVLNIHALSKVILNIHDFSSWRLAGSAKQWLVTEPIRHKLTSSKSENYASGQSKGIQH